MGIGTEVAFNGVDGATGTYLITATAEDIADVAKRGQLDKQHLEDVRARLRDAEPSLGVVRTVRDASDLSQTGWGVIFEEHAAPEVREALRPLLEFRRREASRINEALYREYFGPSGYHVGESAQDFLTHRGARQSGSVDPEQMPYYLLIVGDPQSIPYDFQYQLDVQYAVGRICFDTMAEYHSYASSVVRAETANARPRRAAFVGVANQDDRATQLSRSYLIEPLARDALVWQRDDLSDQPWDIQTYLGPQASKQQLSRLLGGADTPALLLTASHGIGFANEHPLQVRHQGALVSQDWAGPVQPTTAALQEVYFSADDVAEDARLEGLLAFHFACFSAGTPRFDDLPQLVDGRVQPTGTLGTSFSMPIAPRSFVARLPQRLLGHPQGGALAVVGHVERALGSSFFEDDSHGQPTSPPVFRGALSQLMRGDRLGAAIEPFNERYAELCSKLEAELRRVLSFGYQPDPVELARLWMGAADARGYSIFGDPAVRLVASSAPGSPVSLAYEVTSPAPPPAPSAPPAPTTSFDTVRLPPGVELTIDPQTGRISLTITPVDNGARTDGEPLSLGRDPH